MPGTTKVNRWARAGCGSWASPIESVGVIFTAFPLCTRDKLTGFYARQSDPWRLAKTTVWRGYEAETQPRWDRKSLAIVPLIILQFLKVSRPWDSGLRVSDSFRHPLCQS